MIIECPACQSRYRIREERLPPAGGNIKCPNCAHVFFVTRDGAASEAVRSATGSSPVTPATTGTAAAVAPPPPVAAPADPLPGDWSVLPGVNAPADSAAVPFPPPAENASTRARTWKLRNAVGLVYNFSDVDSLTRWLQGKDSHDGLVASDDNGLTWKGLQEFAELHNVMPTRKTMLGIAGVPPPPTAGDAAGSRTGENPFVTGESSSISLPTLPKAMDDTVTMQVQAQARLREARKARGVADAPAAPRSRPPVRRIRPPVEKPSESRAIYIAAAVVIPLLALVALNIAGVVNLNGLVRELTSPAPREGFLPPPTPQGPQTARPTQAEATDQPVQPAQLTPAQQVARLIDQAAAAVLQQQYDNAVGLLERALFLQPDSPEVACQLAALYTRLQREADADRVQRICNAQNAPPTPDEGVPADPNPDNQGDQDSPDDGEDAP